MLKQIHVQNNSNFTFNIWDLFSKILQNFNIFLKSMISVVNIFLLIKDKLDININVSIFNRYSEATTSNSKSSRVLLIS